MKSDKKLNGQGQIFAFHLKLLTIHLARRMLAWVQLLSSRISQTASDAIFNIPRLPLQAPRCSRHSIGTHFIRKLWHMIVLLCYNWVHQTLSITREYQNGMPTQYSCACMDEIRSEEIVCCVAVYVLFLYILCFPNSHIVPRSVVIVLFSGFSPFLSFRRI